MIYVLVAATFTPLLVAAVDGLWVAVGLAGGWGLAALGLAREFWLAPGGRGLLLTQMLIGSLCLVPLGLTLLSLDVSTSLLVVVGGVVYLAGLVMFVNDLAKPRARGVLAPRDIPCVGDPCQHQSFHCHLARSGRELM
jgi:channel protein (hemolysin III family)